MLAGLFALTTLTGCGELVAPFSSEEATAVVQDAFTAANPGGRTGSLLRGKAVWLETDVFDKSCLEEKDLAFNDDPANRPTSAAGKPRISATYEHQKWLTASTEQGYCVYMGDDPTLEVGEVAWNLDRYRVNVTYGLSNATPWWECVANNKKSRVIEVVDEGGKPALQGSMALFEGDCPHPLPSGETRKGSSTPNPTGKEPSKSEVAALVEQFDKALYDGDFVTALDMVSCYNVFEDPTWGACSAGEIVSVGPSFTGNPRAQDGTPWLEYVATDAGSLGKLKRDRKIKGRWHVMMKHKRSGKARSFAVERVGGALKLVGVVGRQAEAITAVRFVYDLHDRDKSDILTRRLEGEEIDEAGNPTVPVEEEEQ